MLSYQSILEHEFTQRSNKNSSYSLRAFANSLGINHGALSQLLSGKRVPSYKMMQKIIIELDLNATETFEFQKSVVTAYIAKNQERINPEFKKLAKSIRESKESVRNLNIEKFKVIADWYHYAIFMMLQKDNFSLDLKAISKSLEIKEIQVKAAIERLELVGLIEIKEDEITCNFSNIDTKDKKLTSSAHKKRQRQILEKSIHALETHDISKRNHQCMTMAIDPEKLPQAKKKIQQFINELSNFLEGGKKTNIYEFTTSLFSLEKLEE